MRMNQLIEDFELQRILNPVVEEDLPQALEYFIVNGFNISDTYHTNPTETYRPQMSERILAPRLRNLPPRTAVQGVPLKRSSAIWDGGIKQAEDTFVHRWIKTHLSLQQRRSPEQRMNMGFYYNLDIPLEELPFFLGNLGNALYTSTYSPFGITKPLYFSEENSELAKHLKDELLRCNGDIYREEHTDEGVVHTLMTSIEIYTNLNLYAFMRDNVPNFAYKYWRLDRLAVDNIRSLGYDYRAFVKLVLLYLMYSADRKVPFSDVNSNNLSRVNQEKTLSDQWSIIANYFPGDNLALLCERVFAPQNDSEDVYSAVIRNLAPIRRLSFVIFNGVHRRQTERPIHTLYTTGNVLDSLWLLEHHNWIDGNRTFKEEGFIIHHHEILKEWSKDPFPIDYSKPPSFYAEATHAKLLAAAREEIKKATPYPRPGIVDKLDPKEMEYIPHYPRLRQEGLLMRNCAGSYDEECESGESIFFHYHDGTQHGATVEVCVYSEVHLSYYPGDDWEMFKIDDNTSLYINEIKGFANEDVSEVLEEAVHEIFRRATALMGTGEQP